jgi:hypothetical protein
MEMRAGASRSALVVVMALFAAVPVLSAQEKKQESITAAAAKTHVLAEGEFQGVKLDTPLSALERRFGKKLRKAVMKTGEGDFEYYSLRNETGQEIAQFFLTDDKRVRMVETTSPLWKTTRGIRVGSTLRELRRAYPDLEIHGSEIESRTSASSAATKWSFRIDTHFGSYELSPKELASIAPETKILAIFLLGPVD